MKTTIITISFILLGFINALAQTISKPPKTNSSSSYSTSTSVNTNGKERSNTSISISNSDDFYKLRAKFSKEKTEEVKSIILAEMGSKNPEIVKDNYIWDANSNNKQVYEINLSNGKASMFIDKVVASNDLIEKFDEIGIQIKAILSDSDVNEKQLNADRLLRDAELMRRDAERMQREANRLKEISQHDADRYNKEAKQYKAKANDLEDEAKHNGGVSTIIKKLLDDDKTIFDEDSNSISWKWPVFQKEFLENLIKENIVKNSNEINMIIDDSGFYVNSKKLTSSQMNTYSHLFDKYNFYFENFSFNKKNKHIVVIEGSNINLEEVIMALKSHHLISSISKKTKIEINGNSVLKDGIALSKEEVAIYNKILQKHHVIPAPGKTLEIMQKGVFKLGYSVNDKTYIGTWTNVN